MCSSSREQRRMDSFPRRWPVAKQLKWRKSLTCTCFRRPWNTTNGRTATSSKGGWQWWIAQLSSSLSKVFLATSSRMEVSAPSKTIWWVASTSLSKQTTALTIICGWDSVLSTVYATSKSTSRSSFSTETPVLKIWEALIFHKLPWSSSTYSKTISSLMLSIVLRVHRYNSNKMKKEANQRHCTLWRFQ